jgi:transposase
MPAGPAPFLTAIAPYRADRVVCVACLFPWYWLAELCARAGLPFVLGHALSMPAIHGGTATNDQLDAQTIAVLRRGGRRPQASVSPAERRATRAVLRRRVPLTRQRAELLAHIQHTTRQDNVPEIGKTIASNATRDGVAARFPEPAGQTSVAGDRARMEFYDPLRRDVAWTMVPTATQHDAQTFDRWPSVPGIGKMLRCVLLYAMHASTRFPRGQDGVSSCRWVTCAREAAGKRSGTAGAKMGHSSLTGAFAAAAVRLLRTNPVGQQSRARWENKHGKGQALTV